MGKLPLLLLFLSVFLTSSLAIRFNNLELDENEGRQCEIVCEKHGSEPWKCKKSCKDIGLGELELDDNQGRQCEVVCEKHGSEPWKCEKSCKEIGLEVNTEVDENKGRQCEMVCERHGSEPWKCKKSCKEIESGENPSQGRECETVCERHGSEPWECKKSCKEIELGDLDLQRFAKCQQKCLGKQGDKCLRRCVQESQSQRRRRGGSIMELATSLFN